MTRPASQLAAEAARNERRKAAALKPLTVWLSPEAWAGLDALVARYGSREKAVEAALMGLAAYLPGTPPKPATTAPKRPNGAVYVGPPR